MPDIPACAQCGLPLPDGAAEGLCPRCLMESALGAGSTGAEPIARPLLPNWNAALPDFGPYHAIGVLGEGGMGIVYLAEQREPIRRRVALKVLKRGDDRPSFIARFESERQALAVMDHPHIAHVYEAGATADGRPYFVMEYVPGIPITDYCDRNLLGFRERLALFQQVCQAVQHAHQRGIIHRDLKPSNVLVTLLDGKPVPKVIDFGVAKAVNQRLTEKTLFTETGMLIGTPEYMSPEQADLTGLDVDATTDVYSLGVLLYELLVGALPFDAKELRRAGYAEIQRVIREQEPPRPTTRLSGLGQTATEIARRRKSDVRTLIRLLRGDLEWITMKALEKDRTRRYASASDFAADIGRHLASEPVSAGPPTFAYRFQKAVRRNRGKIAAAAVIAAALALGLIPSVFQRQPAGPGVMAQHKIEIPGGGFGPHATDGRRTVYRDDATGELIYTELGTKIRQVVFKAKPDDLLQWMPSRDFSMVALQFGTKPNRPAFIAVVQIDGKGYRELIRERQPNEFVGWGLPAGALNWSWDNRYLLMGLADPEAGNPPRRVLVVSTSSAERRELLNPRAGMLYQCAFSPDSRFVACNFWPEPGTSDPARILIVPAQGGPPRLIREDADGHLELLDWTADGRFLAICMDHNGKWALQLLPVREGQPSGEPILLQSGLYDGAATARDGTLVYQKTKPGGLFATHLVSLDAGGRLETVRKLDLPGENSNNPWPRWSPDGTRIVYVAHDAETTFGNSVVRVRNLATGDDREIYRSHGSLYCAWAARQPRILCSRTGGVDSEILTIAPDSGHGESLGHVSGAFLMADRPSGDGRFLYLVRYAKQRAITARWEIATGRETILEEGPGDDPPAYVSPDEHWLVRSNYRQIDLRPISGGTWKTIVFTSSIHLAITPDGKWLFYHGMDSAGNHDLNRVPTAGGQPEHLGAFPINVPYGTMEFSPDGRRMIVASFDDDHAYELWALENFVPAASKR
jgi:serine/threonine protein kinase/Tol biopolymer transport system component